MPLSVFLGGIFKSLMYLVKARNMEHKKPFFPCILYFRKKNLCHRIIAQVTTDI
jgi:hypothetical protein